MPELPEVEIIKLGLEKKIVGKTIKKIEVLTPKTFPGKVSEVEGRKVVEVWRRAKMLGIDFEGGITLLFHLKLTGQLIWLGEERLIGGHPTADMEGKMPNQSTRVIFEFDDPLRPRLASTQARSGVSGSKLFFNDQRKFGWIRLVQRAKIKDQKELKSLGPEPLEKGFTWQVLKENLLKHPNTPIKVALMDQSAVAGVGNIYANETLFLAGVDPRRKVVALSDEEFQKIQQGIINCLKLAIKYGGSTRQHFRDVEGNKGNFLSYAQVYGRQGQPCQRCLGLIKKITLSGRGTYFCPSCQK